MPKNEMVYVMMNYGIDEYMQMLVDFSSTIIK